MRILIVGAGVVGANLAEQLSAEGHDVSIVDRSGDRIREIEARLDVLAIKGDAARSRVLDQAGIGECDRLVAVTDRDEVNLVLAAIGREREVEQRIVRVRNDEYAHGAWANVPAAIGADRIINPESLVVDSLVELTKIPGAVDVASFHSTFEGEPILLIGFDVGSDAGIAGKKLSELAAVSALDGFRITAVIRDGDVIVPKGDDSILAGDRIYVVVSREFIEFVLNLLGRQAEPTRRIVILGGTPMAVNLAARLEATAEHLTLIESSRDRAEAAASILDRTTVVEDQGREVDLMKSQHVDRADFFMALSRDDENNAMLALLARQLGARRTAVLTERPDYGPLIDALGVDVVVNPRLVAVGEILRSIRRGRIHNVAKIAAGGAEVLEMEVVDGSPASRKPLSKLRFPGRAIIGAVIRGGDLMVPGGDTQLQAGDEVIVFSLPEALPEVEKLFTPRRRLL